MYSQYYIRLCITYNNSDDLSWRIVVNKIFREQYILRTDMCIENTFYFYTTVSVSGITRTMLADNKKKIYTHKTYNRNNHILLPSG